MDADSVYYHEVYNAVLEAHMRACPDGKEFDPKKATPLCIYLTGVLSSANWMIVEGENGEAILEYMEESLVGVPPAAEYYEDKEN